jgi:hypothetical protein
MYFFDIEDYAGTTREMFNADLKVGKGGGGINYCGRPIYHSDWNDAVTTGRETARAHQVAVHNWFTATTINIGNSTNTLAREIYYNHVQPNWVQYRIDWIKYINQAWPSKKYWDSKCIDNKLATSAGCLASYENFWAYYVNIDLSVSVHPNTGATTYTIFSANSTTNTMVSNNVTIVHPQFNDWNDSYYYNQNNSLRKYMGSLKALMKAIDNDDFEEITL